MSTSYNAGVILGVKLDEIGFTAELISTPYQVHNKKGEPTGKTEYEKNWQFNFQGEEINSEGSDIYSDFIEDIINIKKPLKLMDISYEGSDIDNIIIGATIVSNGYNDYQLLKEIDTVSKFDLVKSELKAQFGVDVEPKLYFYFNVS